MTAAALLAALQGRFDRWWWSPGLTPDVLGTAIGRDLSPAPVRPDGRPQLQTAIEVESQPYPVWLRWEMDGELALVQFSEPVVDPSWAAVLSELGDPDVIFEHGRGPVPGGDQRCHLDRGLTIFDSGGLGYQAVWLYPPMTAEEYPERTGAFEPIHRAREMSVSHHHAGSNEHEERRADGGRPHLQRAADDAGRHPLLDLQQQAGNAAVAQLMAVQRHTLDPDEEHG